jgi:hypothetical protein
VAQALTFTSAIVLLIEMKIEWIGTSTRRVADRTARQETLLPGRDGFMERDPDQIPWWSPFPLCRSHRWSGPNGEGYPDSANSPWTDGQAGTLLSYRED